MKNLLYTLCSIVALTLCFTPTTLGAGNTDNVVASSEEKTIQKSTIIQQTQNRFSRMTQRQYLMTAAVVAASAIVAYYCPDDECPGIANAISKASPTLITYFGLSTFISATLS